MMARSSLPFRLLSCLLVTMLAGSSSNPASADDFHGYWVNEYDSRPPDMGWRSGGGFGPLDGVAQA